MVRILASIPYVFIAMICVPIVAGPGSSHDEFAIGYMARVAAVFVLVSLTCAVCLYVRLRHLGPPADEDLDGKVGGAMLVALITGFAALAASLVAAGALLYSATEVLAVAITAVPTAAGAAAPYIWAGRRAGRQHR